jgi:hypothetical protein
MDIYKECINKHYIKNILIECLLEEVKEGDKNKVERRRTQSNGRMWSRRWRLGRQTWVETGSRNTPYAIERLHTIIIKKICSAVRTMSQDGFYLVSKILV